MKYTVLRQHYGDKQYHTGDERVIDNEQDAQALVEMGLITPFDDEPKQKAKTAPKNKAESSPQNKAES